MSGKKIYSDQVVSLVDISTNTHDLNLFFKSNRALGQLLKTETSFLSNNARARERLWYVENETTTPPTCKHVGCSSQVKWNNLNRGFQPYCSVKCAKNDPDHMAKVKQTCIDNYGVDHPWKNEQVRECQRKTMVGKYGVENPLHNEGILARRDITNIERYGTPHSCMNADVQRLRNQTMMTNYGTIHPMRVDAIRQQVSSTHNSKYGSTRYFSRRLHEYGIPIQHGSTTSAGEIELVDYIKTFYTGIVTVGSKGIIFPHELDVYLPDNNLTGSVNMLNHGFDRIWDCGNDVWVWRR